MNVGILIAEEGGFQWTNILISIAAIAAIFILLKLLKSGFKKILGFLLNALIGCVILYVFSLIPGVEFSVAWWHAVVTGLFGIPAAIIIIVVTLVT